MKISWILSAAILVSISAGAQACDKTNGSLQHPASGEIYKTFGYVTHPILKRTRLHSGIDYSGPTGGQVVAADGGTVVVAGREGAYGNYVRIDHGNGMQTSYAHMDKIGVKQGDCVARGADIGTIGQTGVSSGPHLHFEILQNSRFVDPIPRLPARS